MLLEEHRAEKLAKIKADEQDALWSREEFAKACSKIGQPTILFSQPTIGLNGIAPAEHPVYREIRL